MELVVLSGIQGAGKSSWFRQNYAHTHVHLGRDIVGTQNRETVLFHSCLAIQQRVVIDNTNVTRAARQRYAQGARAAGFATTLVVFHVPTEVALERNARRSGMQRVPDRAVLGTAAKLESADWGEGFDRILDVWDDGEHRRVEERVRE